MPVALELAAAVGCTKLNALAGHAIDSVGREAQLELARENVRFAADAAAEQGADVLIEAINTFENGPVPALAHGGRRPPSSPRSSARTSGCSTTRTTCSAWRAT